MQPQHNGKCLPSYGHDGTASDVTNEDPRVAQEEKQRPVWEKRPMSAIWNFIFDLEQDCTTDPIFPPFFIFLLMPFVFWTRYALLSRPEGLGIRDPEEHWDTVEVANNYVRGFGPHRAKFLDGRKDDPKAEADDCHTPSWILTAIFAMFLKSFRCFGWNTTSFEAARIFHGLVAATLPYSVYKFTRAMFRQCRDVALLAAFLVAFSKPLMLTASHPYAEGLLSPISIFAVTMVVNIPKDQLGSSRSTACRSGFGTWCAGYILGVVISIHPSSMATIGPMLAFLNLPKIHTMSATWTRLTAGGLLGIASGVSLDHVAFLILGQQTSNLPSAVTNCDMGATDHSRTFSQYFGMFWGSGWLHGGPVLTALAFSFLNWTCTWNRSCRMTAWIASDQTWCFGTVTNLTIMSLTSSFIVSCSGSAKLHRIHGALILILVAGASGLHFWYRSFYTRLKRSKVSAMKLDLVELALYCQLGLYAWASWSCLPLDADNSLRDVLRDGWPASANYNGGLKYVGQQTDFTGVVLDFPVGMTGGRALLGRDVPLVSRTDSGWVEHGRQPDNTNQGQSLLERYNYIIVSRSRKFSIRGFYEVHRNGGIRTFRFYGNGYRAKVFEDGPEHGETVLAARGKDVMGDGPETASLLESEGGLWHLLGDYAKAKEMLARARQLDPDKFESWTILMESLYLLGEIGEMEKMLTHCRSLSESECDIAVR